MRNLLTVALLLTATPALAQADPTPAQTEAVRSSGPCRDPWITIAYKRIYGDGFVPSQWMCKAALYRNGVWDNFAQLQTAVRGKDYGRYTYKGVVLTGSGPLAGRTAIGIFLGANLVAAGGGNLVAADGGNLVAAGGGNLVAAGGGNIIMLDAGRLVSPGQRTLLSAGAKPVPVMD